MELLPLPTGPMIITSSPGSTYMFKFTKVSKVMSIEFLLFIGVFSSGSVTWGTFSAGLSSMLSHEAHSELVSMAYFESLDLVIVYSFASSTSWIRFAAVKNLESYYIPSPASPMTVYYKPSISPIAASI